MKGAFRWGQRKKPNRRIFIILIVTAFFLLAVLSLMHSTRPVMSAKRGESSLIKSGSLALRPTGHRQPMKFTDTDEAFFRMLGGMGPGDIRSILIMTHPYEDPEDLKQALWVLSPGGFLLVNGPYEVWLYYKAHFFMRLPFMWHDYQIFRKPGGEPIRVREAAA